MMNVGLYKETFSRLQASDEAKKEVFQKMETMKKRRRLPRILRSAAMAAAVVMALAVTAGAVNMATDGMLFRILWSSGTQMELVDGEGNHVHVTVSDVDVVTEEDGRLLLHAGGETIDITDELAQTGSCHYEYTVDVTRPDGGAEPRTVTVDVTGSPEAWTATQSDGSGVSYTTAGGSGRS